MAGGHTSTAVTSGGVRSVASSGSVPGDAQLPPYVSSPAGAGVWIVEDEKAFAILVREYPGQKVQFNMQVRCVCVCLLLTIPSLSGTGHHCRIHVFHANG